MNKICHLLNQYLIKKLTENYLLAHYQIDQKEKLVWRLCEINKIYHKVTKYFNKKLNENWLIKETGVKTLLNE